MNRRQFLLRAGGLLVILPSARALADVAGKTPKAPKATGLLTFTSTVTGDHRHTVSLGRWVIASPPALGVDGLTSEAGHHQHEVRLSHADIAQLAAGKTVIRQTTTVVGHHHQFLFRLPKAG